MKAEEFTEGESVLYSPGHARGDRTHEDCEHGIVSSQNGVNVFVQYYRNGILQHTAQSTSPEDLLKPNTAGEWCVSCPQVSL